MDDGVQEYIERHYELLLDELKEWLRIPSISALPEHAGDVAGAARWVRDKLGRIGFSGASLIETSGHPLVYAEYNGASGQPTLLVYGHYDVQPVDPVDEWLSPPFAPEVRDGNLYGRGTTDDKGQVMIVLAALEAWFAVTGGLPVNVKVLLEGEEEAGGEGIHRFVLENSKMLAADAALICDTQMLGPEMPSLIIGLRGILYTEIRMRGAVVDLHSGSYGGVAPNPLHALCVLISRLKGEDGVIRIPELTEAVEPVSEVEQRFLHDDPLDIVGSLKTSMGVETLVGNADHPPLERLGVRPTLEVHGIRGGFIGEGAKTVIPAEAVAKLSLRLPACLTADEVFVWLKKAVMAHVPAGYRVELINLHGGKGMSVDIDNTYLRAAVAALTACYGVSPVFMREGGSIPIAALFCEILHLPVVLMGFGLADDRAHAPNEKLSLDQFRKGMQAIVDYLGRIRK